MVGHDGVLELGQVLKVPVHVRGEHHVHDGLAQRLVLRLGQVLENVNVRVAHGQLERQRRVVVLQNGSLRSITMFLDVCPIKTHIPNFYTHRMKNRKFRN